MDNALVNKVDVSRSAPTGQRSLLTVAFELSGNFNQTKHIPPDLLDKVG